MKKKKKFLFVFWRSTMMSDSWKANSFQDCSLIRNHLKTGTFFMHSTKLKWLFTSSKDKRYAHTKATGTWPTLDEGTTCWLLPFCWLPHCPALGLISSAPGRRTSNFQNLFRYSLFLKKNAFSGTSTFGSS